MNTRNDVTIMSPNDKDELCGEFVIDDTSIPFVLNGVAQIGENYVLSFWMRSNSNALLKVGDAEILISTKWERYKFIFTATEESIKIYFNNKQNYYLYRAQLETGNVLTDWSPSPDDIKASLEVKIDTENLISEINASADIIRLTGDRIVIDSTYFKVEEDGTVVASNMTITGTSQFISEQSEDSEDYTGSRVVIENGIIRIYDNQNRMASHNGFQSYYGGTNSEEYYSTQGAKGVYVRDLDDNILCAITNTGIYGAKNKSLNWDGKSNIKELNVNGYPVYGDKLISFKTTPYSGETGRTISINSSMSKCQKGTGHVSIVEQYKVVLTSSGSVSAGGILRLGKVPEMYIPTSRVAACFYVNEAGGRMYSGNINTDGTVEVRPSIEMGSGTYYIAVSANYLLKASNIQDASYSIVEQPESKEVDVGTSVTFRVETDLPGTDTNTQFVWQTSSNNGSTWSNVKVHTPMANYSEYTISSVSESQDGLMVRCTINRGDEIVVSDVAILSTTKEVYNVTYNLTNCTSSNNASTVIEGDSYETYINFNDGYTNGSGTVTMGGTNITSSALAGDRISISKVTGNIVITYSATKIETGGGDSGGDSGGDNSGGNDSGSGDNTGGAETVRITKQPQSVTVPRDQGATFTIEAEGTGLLFQWQKGTTPASLSNDDNFVSSSNASTFTIEPQTGFVKYSYYVRCIVTDGGGKKVTSDTVQMILQS